MQYIELSSTELNLVLLGALQSHMNLSSDKKRHHVSYFFRGVQVCKETFLFVYCIGKSRLENLKAHLKRYGAVPRIHANTSRLPKNVLEHAVLNQTVSFIKNFTTEHGVSLLGRAPSLKDLKVQLLPSSESEASIWRQYKKVSEDGNLTVVSYTKFVALWNTLTPYIVVMKPASDLCSPCQLNNTKINQNVVCLEYEGIPRQVNYLIVEAGNVGKGANSTISYVHDFFTSHTVGETDAQINTDNCGGQNKNNFVIWYYCWRILCGMHDCKLYSFLIAGHTKFSPDWCFGLIKHSFRRRYVSSLLDLMEAVDQSTVTGVNISKLCGLHDGTVLVAVYDWAKFIEPFFKKIPGVSKFHHF